MIPFRALFALLLGLAITSFVFDQPAHADVTELNVVAPERAFPRVWRAYPTMDARYARTGSQRSVAQVRRIAIGSSKSQLVSAIGNPVSAFRDGSWNFNVSLRLPQRNRLICQYRVYFDDNDRVAGTAWRRPQCADIVAGRRN